MTKTPIAEVNKTATKTDLFIIDGSAPFFAPFVDGTRKNWSKAPLEELPIHGKIPAKITHQICADLRIYCRRVHSIGYNAITFDDLAHITLFDFYPYLLSRTVHSYQKLFRRVFKIAKEEGLKIYVTTDIMFCNRFIETHTQSKDHLLRELFIEALERLFDMFPQVDGVVTRIGEPDGVDVNSAFKSRLVIRTAKQCNRWLQAVLPVVESHKKQIIFRTWGLGAFSIGDINWNANTQKRAFANIHSSSFIVSHKYGAGDFFRYLPLNDFIQTASHMQIIELQARREYEGFGVFPAYVGRQYEQLRDQLESCQTLRGISVWCQTGGWSHFDSLTFLETSSPWNELNTITAVRLFSSNKTADEILDEFCQQRFAGANPDTIVEIVSLFDLLIDQLWYFVPFAQTSLWFRRLRVPPLLWIFWDTILVNRALRLVFKTFQPNAKVLRQKDRELRKVLRRLDQLVKELPSKEQNLRLGIDTFTLIINLRRFYLGSAGKKRERKVKEKIKAYRQKYPRGFAIECDFAPFHIRWITSGLLFSFFMRKQARYRWLDRLLLIPLTGWMFPIIKRWQRRRIPDIAERQAAGLELFFR
ncbi:hypothetical protein SAMN05660420_01690 [Desulfuromusa kysingii]|uniref:Glycosyl hydrolase family 67 N-terminus n=1 Tax=Desulfuromusa kysingii TaxID=37625 RepID=A0A1H3ZUX2_9BACT|nr:hypothetical protein [Desulfuromusa kysingii]SEA27576.1 hypothetical protein SAMN05660420_01690 [Desulfuromusa kysingii]